MAGAKGWDLADFNHVLRLAQERRIKPRSAIAATVGGLYFAFGEALTDGERQFMGVRQIAGMVRNLREEYGFPIFLNADHTHSLPSAMEAANAGFDWIVFDASSLPFEENVSSVIAIDA